MLQVTYQKIDPENLIAVTLLAYGPPFRTQKPAVLTHLLEAGNRLIQPVVQLGQAAGLAFGGLGPTLGGLLALHRGVLPDRLATKYQNECQYGINPGRMETQPC